MCRTLLLCFSSRALWLAPDNLFLDDTRLQRHHAARRERLDAARLIAANEDSEGREDLQARMRMLGGYTRYLRSLQTMVKDVEESRP